MIVGTWTRRRDDGEDESKQVLIKSISKFNEKEVRWYRLYDIIMTSLYISKGIL